MVEAAPEMVGRAQVGLIAVARKRQSGVQVAHDERLVLREAVEPFADRCEFGRDRLLLFGVEIGRDDPAEVAVEQLFRPVAEAGPFQLQVGCLTDGLPKFGFDLRTHGRAELVTQFRRERHVRVERDDELLDVRDGNGGRVAVVPLGGSTGTDEVLVEGAVSVDGPLYEQAAAARAAVNGALEIVRVLPNLLAHDVRREDELDLLPRHGRDERLMPAFEDRALKANDSRVVGVRQDLVELVRVDRLGGA
nr:hypothetical protein [Curtobacterium sp. GD1]